MNQPPRPRPAAGGAGGPPRPPGPPGAARPPAPGVPSPLGPARPPAGAAVTTPAKKPSDAMAPAEQTPSLPPAVSSPAPAKAAAVATTAAPSTPKQQQQSTAPASAHGIPAGLMPVFDMNGRPLGYYPLAPGVSLPLSAMAPTSAAATTTSSSARTPHGAAPRSPDPGGAATAVASALQSAAAAALYGRRGSIGAVGDANNGGANKGAGGAAAAATAAAAAAAAVPAPTPPSPAPRSPEHPSHGTGGAGRGVSAATGASPRVPHAPGSSRQGAATTDLTVVPTPLVSVGGGGRGAGGPGTEGVTMTVDRAVLAPLVRRVRGAAGGGDPGSEEPGGLSAGAEVDEGSFVVGLEELQRVRREQEARIIQLESEARTSGALLAASHAELQEVRTAGEVRAREAAAATAAERVAARRPDDAGRLLLAAATTLPGVSVGGAGVLVAAAPAAASLACPQVPFSRGAGDARVAVGLALALPFLSPALPPSVISATVRAVGRLVVIPAGLCLDGGRGAGGRGDRAQRGGAGESLVDAGAASSSQQQLQQLQSLLRDSVMVLLDGAAAFLGAPPGSASPSPAPGSLALPGAYFNDRAVLCRTNGPARDPALWEARCDTALLLLPSPALRNLLLSEHALLSHWGSGEEPGVGTVLATILAPGYTPLRPPQRCSPMGEALGAAAPTALGAARGAALDVRSLLAVARGDHVASAVDAALLLAAAAAKRTSAAKPATGGSTGRRRSSAGAPGGRAADDESPSPAATGLLAATAADAAAARVPPGVAAVAPVLAVLHPVLGGSGVLGAWGGSERSIHAAVDAIGRLFGARCALLLEVCPPQPLDPGSPSTPSLTPRCCCLPLPLSAAGGEANAALAAAVEGAMHVPFPLVPGSAAASAVQRGAPINIRDVPAAAAGAEAATAGGGGAATHDPILGALRPTSVLYVPIFVTLPPCSGTLPSAPVCAALLVLVDKCVDTGALFPGGAGEVRASGAGGAGPFSFLDEGLAAEAGARIGGLLAACLAQEAAAQSALGTGGRILSASGGGAGGEGPRAVSSGLQRPLVLGLGEDYLALSQSEGGGMAGPALGPGAPPQGAPAPTPGALPGLGNTSKTAAEAEATAAAAAAAAAARVSRTFQHGAAVGGEPGEGAAAAASPAAAAAGELAPGGARVSAGAVPASLPAHSVPHPVSWRVRELRTLGALPYASGTGGAPYVTVASAIASEAPASTPSVRLARGAATGALGNAAPRLPGAPGSFEADPWSPDTAPGDLCTAIWRVATDPTPGAGAGLFTEVPAAGGVGGGWIPTVTPVSALDPDACLSLTVSLVTEAEEEEEEDEEEEGVSYLRGRRAPPPRGPVVTRLLGRLPLFSPDSRELGTGGTTCVPLRLESPDGGGSRAVVAWLEVELACSGVAPGTRVIDTEAGRWVWWGPLLEAAGLLPRRAGPEGQGQGDLEWEEALSASDAVCQALLTGGSGSDASTLEATAALSGAEAAFAQQQQQPRRAPPPPPPSNGPAPSPRPSPAAVGPLDGHSLPPALPALQSGSNGGSGGGGGLPTPSSQQQQAAARRGPGAGGLWRGGILSAGSPSLGGAVTGPAHQHNSPAEWHRQLGRGSPGPRDQHPVMLPLSALSPPERALARRVLQLQPPAAAALLPRHAPLLPQGPLSPALCGVLWASRAALLRAHGPGASLPLLLRAALEGGGAPGAPLATPTSALGALLRHAGSAPPLAPAPALQLLSHALTLAATQVSLGAANGLAGIAVLGLCRAPPGALLPLLPALATLAVSAGAVAPGALAPLTRFLLTAATDAPHTIGRQLLWSLSSLGGALGAATALRTGALDLCRALLDVLPDVATPEAALQAFALSQLVTLCAGAGAAGTKGHGPLRGAGGARSPSTTLLREGLASGGALLPHTLRLPLRPLPPVIPSAYYRALETGALGRAVAAAGATGSTGPQGQTRDGPCPSDEGGQGGGARRRVGAVGQTQPEGDAGDDRSDTDGDDSESGEEEGDDSEAEEERRARRRQRRAQHPGARSAAPLAPSPLVAAADLLQSLEDGLALSLASLGAYSDAVAMGLPVELAATPHLLLQRLGEGEVPAPGAALSSSPAATAAAVVCRYRPAVAPCSVLAPREHSGGAVLPFPAEVVRRSRAAGSSTPVPVGAALPYSGLCVGAPVPAASRMLSSLGPGPHGPCVQRALVTFALAQELDSGAGAASPLGPVPDPYPGALKLGTHAPRPLRFRDNSVCVLVTTGPPCSGCPSTAPYPGSPSRPWVEEMHAALANAAAARWRCAGLPLGDYAVPVALGVVGTTPSAAGPATLQLVPPDVVSLAEVLGVPDDDVLGAGGEPGAPNSPVPARSPSASGYGRNCLQRWFMGQLFSRFAASSSSGAAAPVADGDVDAGGDGGSGAEGQEEYAGVVRTFLHSLAGVLLTAFLLDLGPRSPGDLLLAPTGHVLLAGLTFTSGAPESLVHGAAGAGAAPAPLRRFASRPLLLELLAVLGSAPGPGSSQAQFLLTPMLAQLLAAASAAFLALRGAAAVAELLALQGAYAHLGLPGGLGGAADRDRLLARLQLLAPLPEGAKDGGAAAAAARFAQQFGAFLHLEAPPPAATQVFSD